MGDPLIFTASSEVVTCLSRPPAAFLYTKLGLQGNTRMVICATQSMLGLVQVRHCEGFYKSHDGGAAALILCEQRGLIFYRKI